MLFIESQKTTLTHHQAFYDQGTYHITKGLFIVVEHIFIPENRFLERLSIKDAETGNFKTYEVARYAPIFKGIEVDQKSDSRSYYKSLEGWKAVAQLNTANSILAGSAPAPAFKVLFTD